MFNNPTHEIDGESCRGCGNESLYWWSEDETEDTMEVYVDCWTDSCTHSHGKRFVNKSKDTTQSALEAVAREIA
jgi:hypothetical protein